MADAADLVSLDEGEDGAEDALTTTELTAVEDQCQSGANVAPGAGQAVRFESWSDQA
jgi:hypothetical protein